MSATVCLVAGNYVHSHLNKNSLYSLSVFYVSAESYWSTYTQFPSFSVTVIIEQCGFCAHCFSARKNPKKLSCSLVTKF